jgi:hypothetical protein
MAVGSCLRVCEADGESGVSADVFEVGGSVDFMKGVVDFFLEIRV